VKDILVAVAKYAFIASPYPVILSLEVHCKLEQQDMLADLLRGVFGKSLVDRRMDGVKDGCLPSPENLKYRILIKVGHFSSVPVLSCLSCMSLRGRTHHRLRIGT
jgi:phosphatidylinositol phospholipase C delta